MSLLTSSISLFLGALIVQAAPTPGNIALARQYAPEWRFHKDEVYWPSSVEFFLKNVDLIDTDGKLVNADPTVSTVDDAANQGAGLFLATDIDANKGGWLRGQNPSTDPSAVYTFIAPKDNGVVDLFYWIFTPFNEAKKVPVVGQVGDHVGDWERMTVRTVDGVATQVDYHAHSDTGSTVPWSEAPKFDNDQRPVGYIAKGSHGLWQKAGTFTYVNAVVFKLQDVTGDDGVHWDTRDSVVPLLYPDTFSGDLDWLNYKGAWGNEGETNCWWHVFYDECEIVSGPTGPLRDDVLGAVGKAKANKKTGNVLSSIAQSAGAALQAKMDGRLSQVLGDAIDAVESSFTVHLAESVMAAIQDKSAKSLAVQQTCESLEGDEDKKEISTTVATVSLSGSKKLTITPQACKENTKLVSYTIGLCSSDAEDSCEFSDNHRPLRAFSKDANTNGAQDAKAIEVTDLDNWNW